MTSVLITSAVACLGVLVGRAWEGRRLRRTVEELHGRIAVQRCEILRLRRELGDQAGRDVLDWLDATTPWGDES